MLLGTQIGGNGTYALSGGTLSVAGTATIGVASLQGAGIANFFHTGGTFTAAALVVGNGLYSISNGATLTVARQELFGSIATQGFYAQSGGLNSAGSFTLGLLSATGGTATISGGTLNITGPLTLGASANGVVNQSGGAVSAGSLLIAATSTNGATG